MGSSNVDITSEEVFQREFQYGAHNYHPLPVALSRAEGRSTLLQPCRLTVELFSASFITRQCLLIGRITCLPVHTSVCLSVCLSVPYMLQSRKHAHVRIENWCERSRERIAGRTVSYNVGTWPTSLLGACSSCLGILGINIYTIMFAFLCRFNDGSGHLYSA